MKIFALEPNWTNLVIKVEVEVGVHEIRSGFTPRLRPSSRQITGHKVLNLISIKNNIYTWDLLASSFLINFKILIYIYIYWWDLKIKFYFSLEILQIDDKGTPFVSTTLRREGWKSNFFRYIPTKLYSFNLL